VKRIGLVLVVAVLATVTTGLRAGPMPVSRSSATVPAAIVIPAIDLHWLIGDENEPDENEASDNAAPGASDEEDGGSNSVPRWAMLAAAGIAVVLLAALTALIVGLVRRYRAWKRRVAFRTRAWVRRVGDDLDRSWRR
jgi:hypothetical protein